MRKNFARFRHVEILIVARSGRRHVRKVQNSLQPGTGLRIEIRTLNADPPFSSRQAHADGAHFAADFNQAVGETLQGQPVRHGIHAVTFGHRAEVRINIGLLFLHKVWTRQLKFFAAHPGARGRDQLRARGLLHHAVRTKAPEIDQRADRRIECAAGSPGQLQREFQNTKKRRRNFHWSVRFQTVQF